MTEEGMLGDPLDEIEAVASLHNAACLARTFYEQAVERGFSAAQAMTLTIAWLHGIAGGKLG